MTNVLDLKQGFGPALAALRSGGLVGVPTETVYGLGADATNESAIAKIFTAKGRPSFNPLICHTSGLNMAEHYGIFSPLARMLAVKFWPGPLTLVVPLHPDTELAPAITAGLNTIALRHPPGIMAELAAALASPIAAPSANSSGKISPTTAEHVADDLGDVVDVILDDGPCNIGIESTIVKIEDNRAVLLREGGIPAEALERYLGRKVERPGKTTNIEAPGQLLAHYAPSLPVRLNAIEPIGGEAFLAFGDTPNNATTTVLNLSPSADLAEAAHNLFAMLKDLDSSGADGIAVQTIPQHGLGAAINDRLARAAHREIQSENVE